MYWNSTGNVGPQNVHTIATTGIGTIQTLNESPAIFTKMSIKDPTAANDRIVVVFQLNEAGTAWCRVTRSDSGETDLKINRILTADWSAVYTPTSDSTITITALENKNYADTIYE